MRVFLVGPGGVGKSTSAPLLAARLGYTTIDLDKDFMNRVGHIGEFIRLRGYEAYARQNSALFRMLLNENSQDTVFALSSGFLVCDGLANLAREHLSLFATTGVPVVLLPSRSLDEAEEIVVRCQLSRGYTSNEAAERKRIRQRFPAYEGASEFRVYSVEEPDGIAKQIQLLLASAGLT